ncbi:unnamed protein product, partial [marine sediment metagenome]
NEGQTTEDLSDIGQGTYIVTVTDANLCTAPICICYCNYIKSLWNIV